MLNLLHITNIAVVEQAEISFVPGFNVLTGETGAGKSIVIDAIGAVLGGRVSRELVRTGADNASVSAVFSGIEQLDWFAENDIDTEDEIVLSRKITAEGKSTCRVNGSPVSAGQLRALGEGLLNIHGQHDGQLLLNDKHHLGYLDSFGELKSEIATYQAAFDAYRTAERALDALQMDEGEKARRMDTLQFQIEELESANLRPGEEDALRERRAFLANAEKLAEAANTAFFALSGSDESHAEPGAFTQISEADGQLSYAAGLSSQFAPVAEAISDLRYGLEDVLEQLRALTDSLHFSPQELDEIEARLSLIGRLRRKYGETEEAMLAFLDRCKNELDEITLSADHALKLESELQATGEAVNKAGEVLRAARQKAATKLEARVVEELTALNMPGVRFAVQMTPQSPDRTGLDELSFLMSANAGEKLGKISKIASGGELARIMLALKSVLAENESICTLVFDEVDTGVSGIAAQRVGEKMSALAAKKQVLCVTHLPQIAALADQHYLISKSVDEQRTYTQITPLDFEGQKREIARLSGGENITELTLQSAAEQLEAAAEYKHKQRQGKTCKKKSK